MLRRHRRAARWTLEQLAEVSGVSARTLSDMERGRSKGPQQRTVTALADALALAGEKREQLIALAREGRLRDHWARPSRLCELPRSVADFTGRAAELVWVSQLVYAEGSPGVGVVGLVTGSAGLGKTTFAVRAAHTVRPSFPDGVLFVDLLGMSQRPLSADDALHLLLRALGAADQQIPAGTQERASLYRALLRDKRVLVVLDNAGSEEQVRPLLPGGGTGRVLITTRRLLAGLEGVRRLALGPLSLPESRALLIGIMGERAQSDCELALTRLAELCGGLPLALRIIGNRLASRPGWGAAELAARLADEERRLEQFTAGDLKIANAFRMSYEQLSDAARRMFRRLAVVPGQGFHAALAAVVGEVPSVDAWAALDDLVDLGLLSDSDGGRYHFHDLVRLFARDRLHAEETASERAALSEMVVSWLLRMATSCGRRFEPGFGPAGRHDADLVVPPSAEAADRWLRENADNWLGAMRAAAAVGRHSIVLDCAESMHWFSERWAHSPHWQEVFAQGADAAAALGDLKQQATQLNYLAWVHTVPPSSPEAVLRCATQALELATRGDALAQVAWAHQYTSTALALLGRIGEAVESSTRAAAMFKTVCDIDSHVQTRAAIARYRLDEGQYAQALEQCLDLLVLLDDPDSGMTPSIAAHCRPIALIRIGTCLEHLGRRAEAVSMLVEGIDAMSTLQMADYRQAEALETLGSLLAREGRAEESVATYLRAAQVFEAIGDSQGSDRCNSQAAGSR
ncbi:helix-turn-helix domain-containing protein [Streptomyces sp. NPDC002403]